jgi:gas vesicle protein
MPTQAEGTALSALEREAEHTRADLIHTVDELHSRVSPQAIKEEVKAYARETGSDLIQSLERRALDNPLQTVAIAAGVAYPAWRLLINIPAPILLIGAGLASSQFGGSSTRGAMARSDKTGAYGKSEQFTESLRRTAQDVPSNLSQAADGLKEKVTDAAEQAKVGVGEIGSRVAEAISDTTKTARVVMSDAVMAATEAASATYRSGMDAASRTGDQLSENFRKSKDSLFETMERHPLLVGGIGLLIGAVIASALPVSQAETRLFGDASDDLKNRARDMASEGLEVAKTAAENVYQESVSRIQEDGLTPEVVRQTVRGVGDQVKNVVQKAAHTLEEDKVVPPAPSIPHSP